ncbi:MAG: O-antigen ligase family protein [Solirubrobacteraceae bacterium]
MTRWAMLSRWTPPAALAALTLGLGFHAGGYFPTAVGVATVVLALLMVARLVFARAPLEGLSHPLTLVIVAMTLLAGWMLLSSRWSGAEFRSLGEANRVLLYAEAVIFFGSWARSDERLGAMLKGILLACVVLCAAGLISRLLPDIWALGVDQRQRRLQYPVTYANTMGLLAALAFLWSFALAANERESRLTRAVAAAAVPVTAATLLLTYSRGAIGAVIVGFVAFILLARQRALVSATLVTLAPAAAAVYVTYRAELLTTADHTTPAAVAQGHRVALVLVIAAVVAALLRAATFNCDRRLAAVRLSAGSRRAVINVAASAGVLMIASLALTIDLPGEFSQQYDRFVRTEALTQEGDLRTRLTDPGSNGRTDAWRVALQDFSASPIHGRGAGTFVLSWNQHRPLYLPFNETHSLYFQMMGELGLIGLALLLLAVLTILVVCAWRARGPSRHLYAALCAGGLTWALAAAVDWQWQMPVASLWLFALGACALAATEGSSEQTEPWPTPWPPRLLVLLGLALIAIGPARVALSEPFLFRAVTAFEREDCGRVVTAARTARNLVSARPEPHELLAYCSALQRDGPQSLLHARRAIERDPHNWRYHYTSAVVKAAFGQDPRGSARTASRLNPREPLVREARKRFRGTDPAGWRRQAAATPITIDYGYCTLQPTSC